MSSLADEATTPSPARRRRDAQATRAALLEAASALFVERGYERTTVRDIGERAGVDPALIARYFDGKEGLYLAALAEDGGPVHDLAPAELAAKLLAKWEEGGHSPITHALVSPALTDEVRHQVREIMGRRIVDPLAARLGGEGLGDPALRAELLVALLAGVALTRANGTLETLARAPRDEVLAALAPVVQRLGGQA